MARVRIISRPVRTCQNVSGSVSTPARRKATGKNVNHANNQVRLRHMRLSSITA
jgi:hypothetical protein